MRGVVQRVRRAQVSVNGEVTGSVGLGLCVLLGVAHGDTLEDCQWLAAKIANLRIFSDDEGKMNLSLLDIQGGALVVSQFTLYGDCRKGRRPSFVQAAEPQKAQELYEKFVQELAKLGVPVETGSFGADMDVDLCNQGPVTLIIERSGGSDI